MQPYPHAEPDMFPFVRPEICLHLPSDSASRQTPLVFGYILPATGQIRDFHPLERAPAGRTCKKAAPERCGLDFSKHKTSPGSAFSFHGLAGFAFHLPAGRSRIGQKHAFCKFQSHSAPFTQSAPVPGGLNGRVVMLIIFPFREKVKRFSYLFSR